MLKVSVIIPTYNRKAYLKQCVDSVLNQSHPIYEIIIVDDGSTDDSLEFLKQNYSSNLDQIKILKQENQGPAAARNYGVKFCSGDYISFLDTDDFWLEDKLKYQCEYLKNHPKTQLLQSEEIWMRNGVRVNPKKKHAKPSGDFFEASLRLCLVSPSAVIIKKDFFESLQGFDESLFVCEDYDLWLRMSLKTQLITLPKAYVMKQGGHSDQLSRKFTAMDRFRVQSLEKIFAQEKLNREQRLQLLIVLLEKLEILAKGFAKRNPNQKNEYEIKWHEYQKIKKDLMDVKSQKLEI